MENKHGENKLPWFTSRLSNCYRSVIWYELSSSCRGFEQNGHKVTFFDSRARLEMREREKKITILFWYYFIKKAFFRGCCDRTQRIPSVHYWNITSSKNSSECKPRYYPLKIGICQFKLHFRSAKSQKCLLSYKWFWLAITLKFEGWDAQIVS